MKVSIIIPTHNRALLLNRAVVSVIEQSFKDFECLIIDDHSTDTTRELIENWQSKDSRIRYINFNGKRNLQAVLNYGLFQANGVYIARLDDDDYWIDKDKLKKQVSFLDFNDNYLLIGTNANFVDEFGKILFSSRITLKDSVIRKKILFDNPFISSTVVFRKDEAKKLGGFSENIKLSGDYDLWLSLGKLGKFTNLSEHSTYIYFSNTKIKERRIIRIQDSIKIIKKFKKDYSGYFFALIIKSFSFLILYIMPNSLSMNKFLYKSKIFFFGDKGV
ncbi:MAG: glycosyltransferase [Patescibacteria group bacterium]|nr:glycosyltransferase [Patescibacteria group bacterium]